MESLSLASSTMVSQQQLTDDVLGERTTQYECARLDKSTRIFFSTMTGRRCGLLGLGKKDNDTQLSFPAHYEVAEALRGYWGMMNEDGSITPMDRPTALVSNKGVRLHTSDLVGMWHDPKLKSTGTAIYETTVNLPCEASSSPPLPDLDGLNTPPTPPMHLLLGD